MADRLGLVIDFSPVAVAMSAAPSPSPGINDEEQKPNTDMRGVRPMPGPRTAKPPSASVLFGSLVQDAGTARR